ncbi:calcium/proton exchanger [Mycena crocata]|nr:calcium/proton exchanger [Mycena crocata]
MPTEMVMSGHLVSAAGIPMVHTLTPVRSDERETGAAAAGRGFILRRAATRIFKPEKRVGRAPSVFRSLKTLLGSWLNLLLVFIPITFVVHAVRGTKSSENFAFAFLALLPIAKIFGIAMEDLTLRVDRHTGTFIRVLAGNTIELISGIIAIIQCQLEVLQASLVGSILVNILLVLGTALIFAGYNFSEVVFDITNAKTASHMLMLGTVAALLPSIFAASFGGSTSSDLEETRTSILQISRAVSVAILLCYCLYLVFQFKSHSPAHRVQSEIILHSTAYPPQRPPPSQVDTEDFDNEPEAPGEEEESSPSMSFPLLVVVGILAIAAISVLSEYLVGSLSALTTSLSKQWVGLILIPLAGTFARHDLIEAGKYGEKDKMNQSLALSMGSSVNLSLFIQPVLILLAWMMKKNLSLLYDPFETLTLFLCVLTVNSSLLHGKSEWLSGAILIVLYVLIAISFWFYTGTHVFSSLILAC